MNVEVTDRMIKNGIVVSDVTKGCRKQTFYTTGYVSNE